MNFYLLTAIAHKPAEGTKATDITAFHLDHRDWQEKGAGRPEVLKSFARPQNFTDPEYDLGFMYFDGFLVIDHKGQPLKPFRGIPLTLSSKLEGWRAEAIRRSDPRIRNTDLIVRMPVKVQPSANGIPTREAVVEVNAVVGRQGRFREQAGAITWGRPTATNIHDFLWSLLPQHCRDNNLALPRDLTNQERWQLRALNVGSNPEKARKIPNADKRITREQYIDGVRQRATQVPIARSGNVRRLRKEAVRSATREATFESLPNVSTSPREELEQAEDVVALPDATEFQLRDSASPLEPASAAFAASVAPATATAATRVRAPLILGPVNPPFPFVRPGEYLFDVYRMFFR